MLLETTLGDNVSQFAYFLVEGMKKTTAHVAVWGYSSQIQIQRNYKKALPLMLLLKEENTDSIASKMHMSKEERLEHLAMTALQAHRMYIGSQEAAHGAVYLKAMAIINTMTGDNAPTEIHHMVKVTNEQLEAMTHSQRTDAYKRMMSGQLTLEDNPIELHATDNAGSRIVEGELVPVEEGGATLGDVGE